MIDTDKPPAKGPDLSAEKGFIQAIVSMKETRKGDLAALKRNAGNTLDDARNVSWFLGTLARFHVPVYQEGIYFVIATLLPLDKKSMDGKPGIDGDFGATMHRVASVGNADGVERRFRILLDARFDETGGGEMAFRLRQAVKLVLSKDAPINWPVLLHDLKLWNSPGKWAQKRWARSYYAPRDIADTEVSSDITAE